MSEKRNVLRVRKTWRRFLISFLIALCFPVVCLVSIFQQSFREIYTNKIVDQAQLSMEAQGRELERSIESLQSVVLYNTLHLNSLGHVFQDPRGKYIIDLIAKELATHPLLDNIYYYNKTRQELIYSSVGTYSLEFFDRIYIGAKDSLNLNEVLNEIRDSGWLSWKDGESIQYVVKANRNEWWFFDISNKKMDRIISGEDSVTELKSISGKTIYTCGTLNNTSGYKISFDSSDGKFQLVRYIDQNSLFAEMNHWSYYYITVVLIVLSLGGILILLLTYYN